LTPCDKTLKYISKAYRNYTKRDKLAESVGNLAVEEPRVKSKNLNVIDEFERSRPKRMANFVVVGKFVSAI
jgi:hypothetical protein